MEVERVWLDALVVGERQRQADPSKVSALAESMNTLGLQQPISVWFDEDDAMHLVAGLHRVRAAEKLGWEQIDAVTVTLDADAREMWEISENLHRADLTKEERDKQIRRYAESLAVRNKNQARQNDAPEIGYKKPPPQEKGIASQVAAETGLSTRTVQRVLAEPKPKVVEVMSDAELDHADFEKAIRFIQRLRPGAQKLVEDYYK
jgi:ParB-like chromosome segregation protein Spo0J